MDEHLTLNTDICNLEYSPHNKHFNEYMYFYDIPLNFMTTDMDLQKMIYLKKIFNYKIKKNTSFNLSTHFNNIYKNQLIMEHIKLTS